MTVELARPWLLVFAALPALALLRAPRRAWSVLQALAAIALCLAATGPSSGHRPQPTVVALDRSASIDAAMRATENAWAAPSHTVVTFAANARVTSPAAPASPGGTTATDLGAGLAAAVDAAPAAGRVIVLSDGVASTAGLDQALAEARLRGIEIDAVPLVDPRRYDVALVRVSAPAAVHAGDTVPLLVTIHSTAAGRARLTVRRDGKAASTGGVVLHAGDNPFTLAYVAAHPGRHSFSVHVAANGDAVPGNDTLAATVDVTAAPLVLDVSSRAGAPLPADLAASGVQVARVAPRALPSSAQALAPYDAVVLDDVPATALDEAQIDALSTAVRLGGAGLLASGGPHSFSLGRYATSPLDTLMPVSSRVPGDLQRRDLALELVVDRSGSMADRVNGVRKIAMAQRASLAAVSFAAAHRDELGVVAFDIAPHVAVPLHRIGPASRVAVAREIGRIVAAGGTDIYLALRAGLGQLSRSASTHRHLILLSDGISQPHDYTALLAQLRRAHIAVATIALGPSADRTLLAHVADATGGAAYATSNARELPRIFAREARLAAKPAELTGRLPVTAAAASPVVRSLAGETLPSLTGTAATDAKALAQTDLVAGHGTNAVPALAQWQVGVGRVVAWMPGVGAPWGARWGTMRALWNDAVRWVARPPATAASVATATSGANGVLTVDRGALGATASAALHVTVVTGARARRVVLRQTAPGSFSAPAPWLHEGVVHVDGRPVAVPYPAEFAPPASPAGALGQLVAESGGRFLTGPPGATLGARRRDRSLGVILAALVLYGAGTALRLTRSAGMRRPRGRAAA